MTDGVPGREYWGKGLLGTSQILPLPTLSSKHVRRLHGLEELRVQLERCDLLKTRELRQAPLRLGISPAGGQCGRPRSPRSCACALVPLPERCLPTMENIMTPLSCPSSRKLLGAPNWVKVPLLFLHPLTLLLWQHRSRYCDVCLPIRLSPPRGREQGLCSK